MNPLDHAAKPIQQVLVEMTNGGLDFTFEAVGSVLTMVCSAHIVYFCTHRNWNESLGSLVVTVFDSQLRSKFPTRVRPLSISKFILKLLLRNKTLESFLLKVSTFT